MPQTTRIVGHDVHWPGDVMVARDIAVAPLMDRVETQEVRADSNGSRRSFVGPRNSGLVVAGNPNSALGDIAMLAQHVLVSDQPGKFEIGDGDGTIRVVRRH